jgi:hypothetical protein
MQLSDKFSLFNECRLNKQSGTFGKSLLDKSTSVKFFNGSRSAGKLARVLFVLLSDKVVSDGSEEI